MTRTVHIVGAGGYARALTDEANVTAEEGICRRGTIVVDPRFLSPDGYSQTITRRQREGWRTVDSFEALLENGVAGDLVVLPVPINLHAPMTCRVLDAGGDVLCEKPAAGSSAEIELMAAAERRSGGRVRFGFQHVLSPSMVRLRNELRDGGIGDVVSIAGRVLWPRPEAYFSRARWAGALRIDGVPVLDSPIQNAGAHFLHAMIEWAHDLGHELRSVTAEHARVNEIETADMQALRIATTGPDIYYLAAHSSVGETEPEILVTGTRGTLRWQFPDRLTIVRSRNRDLPELLVDGPGVHRLNSLALRTALTNPEAGTDLASAERHLAVVHAAFGGEMAPSFPIDPIPDRYRHVVETEYGPLRAIADFPRAGEELFISRRLPSELPVPWSAAVYRVEDEPLRVRGEAPK